MVNPWKKDSKINPQRESGHRQIATDIIIFLMGAKLNGAELSVCLAIIHKTWGHGKQTDTISTSQFQKMTNLAERTIKATIKELKNKKIIYYEQSNIRVHHGSPLNEFLFNKHYDTWCLQGCRKVHACRKVSSKGAEKCQVRVHDSAHTKESITKETLQKKKKMSLPFAEKIYDNHPRKSDKKSSLNSIVKLLIIDDKFINDYQELKVDKVILEDIINARYKILLNCQENYKDAIDKEKTEKKFIIQSNNFFGQAERWKEWIPKKSITSNKISNEDQKALQEIAIRMEENKKRLENQKVPKLEEKICFT